MIDLKNFFITIDQIAEEKGLPKVRVLETIEQAIAAAYKKEYGKKGQVIKAKIDPKKGSIDFWQEKLVVDESMIYSEEELQALQTKREEEQAEGVRHMADDEELSAENKKVRFNPERHIMVEEAKQLDPGAELGGTVSLPLESLTDFGRIAAQTAKQVILQKIKEAERDAIMNEFKSKEGELISGIVQRVEGRVVFVDLGKTLGMFPKEEQVPGEFYKPGQRLKFFVLAVDNNPKGPVILLSRAYPKFISKLFELEVPEMTTGAVEIKGIAREPGSRSKVAVSSNAEGVDPVGSMVGQRGTRVSAVINELGGEKIDIIEWSDDQEKYVANALSPAKALSAEIDQRNKAIAIVPEDQLSLAIGRDGQNVRLAAKLTGWKIDVRTPDGKEVTMEETETQTDEKPEKETSAEKPTE
ncbi:MAG: transcription termination/antitermination protein NusA [Candidatus Wildermuthbacteria bacterium]|nr:transcription termination/antitermination protein NusA [Candidatus Wildermuthbacteria bacterium]